MYIINKLSLYFRNHRLIFTVYRVFSNAFKIVIYLHRNSWKMNSRFIFTKRGFPPRVPTAFSKTLFNTIKIIRVQFLLRSCKAEFFQQ